MLRQHPLYVAACAARPWLVELISGAPLEEAVRPGLMVLCFMQAVLTLALLYPSALSRSSPRTPTTQSKSTVIQGALGGSVVFQVVAVLYGAPVFANADQTFLWAFLMALLVFVPMELVGRSPWSPASWTRWPHTSMEAVVLLGSFGTVLGAWVGAFSIPLDWDRPWQPFPISSTYGALYGHTLGQIIALLFIVTAFVVDRLRPSVRSTRQAS